MTSKEFVKEIEAWLSFNTEPSREETAKLRKSIKDHLTEQLRIHDVIGRFSSLEECENEAISFTKVKLKAVSGLLSEDYKIGYKEGVYNYLASKNDL